MTKPCPYLPGFNTKEIAYKNCSENGTWERANYMKCRMTREIEEDLNKEVLNAFRHIYISLVGFSISITLLVISLFIFFKFRQLRCDRITLHKNLFISYLLTAIMYILYNVLVIMDGDVLHDQPIWCVVLHVVTQYCVVSNFAWMFCEGVYLHTIMVKTFITGKWLIIVCTVIGWVCPFVLVGVYTAVRASSKDDNILCWHQESTLQWIMYAPVVASIFLNLIFLCNIVRLLITKLRQIPEAGQTRKATRATLILIPLLGIQYLMFPIKPAEGSNWEEVYLIVVALHLSLQGAFVSIIFCFCNGEVITVIKRKWTLHRESTFTSKGRYRAPSTIGTTSYTLVDHMSGVATSVT
ncbi:calcitonin receptor-like [Mytilus galloprovincialis]|nr:calcitonin receptor-like [Mytilus galloprovincialis]